MRRIAGTVFALGMLFAAAAPADASETLGKTDFAGACAQNATYIGAGVSSGPNYVAGSSGVITSYAMTRSNNAGSATRQLEVFKFNGGNSFTVVQKDSVRELPEIGVVNRINDVHLPISAGQIVGIHIPPSQPSGVGDCLAATGSALDSWRSFVGDPAFNANAMFSAPSTDSVRLNLEATIEPDADGDTYGDETQDLCPTNASVHTACPSLPSTPPIKKECKKKKGKKRSAEVAKKKRCKKKKNRQ
jgi:hypothetical protein